MTFVSTFYQNIYRKASNNHIKTKTKFTRTLLRFCTDSQNAVNVFWGKWGIIGTYKSIKAEILVTCLNRELSLQMVERIVTSIRKDTILSKFKIQVEILFVQLDFSTVHSTTNIHLHWWRKRRRAVPNRTWWWSELWWWCTRAGDCDVKWCLWL